VARCIQVKELYDLEVFEILYQLSFVIYKITLTGLWIPFEIIIHYRIGVKIESCLNAVS